MDKIRQISPVFMLLAVAYSGLHFGGINLIKF